VHPGLTNPPGLLLTNHPGPYIAAPGGHFTHDSESRFEI